MEPKTTSQWSSLPVPSVQELLKGPFTTVPPQYVRPEQDSPLLPNVANSSSPQVPIIDMQKLLSGDFMDSELERFHQACKDWGFFHLINHGMSTSLIDKLKQEIQEFFNLPMEEKKKYFQQPGDIEGFGQAFVVSEEQKLDWGDMFFMFTLPTHLRKPHLFPKLHLSLRDTLETYCEEMRNLSLKILNQMVKALRMDPNDMFELFEEGWQSVRMNYYPPCVQPELVMGLSAHSDAVGITVLLQINDVEGLQIKKDGKWVAVKSHPGAFVINIGDILEIVTNGIYQSIEHRATINSEKERISIATFYSPNLVGDMGLAPSLLTPETPALFRRLHIKDYYKRYNASELRGKSHMDFIRIQNEESKSF